MNKYKIFLIAVLLCSIFYPATASAVTNLNGGISTQNINTTETITITATDQTVLNMTGVPENSASSSFIQLGNAITGGSANGTYIGTNLPANFSGNFLDMQQGSSTFFSVNANGNFTLGPRAEFIIGDTPLYRGAWATAENDIFNATRGNVGIGVGNPTYALDVNGSVNLNNMVKMASGASNSYLTTSYVENTGPDAGWYNSMKKIGNTVIVSYYEWNSKDLKFAKSTDAGATWTSTIIDTDGTVGFYSELYSTDATTIYIAYANITDSSLKIAKSTDGGTTWNTNVIDSAIHIPMYQGGPISIDGSSANVLYITYLDDTDGVNIAKTTNGGTNWNITNISNSTNGIYTSLKVLDANNIYATFDYANIGEGYSKVQIAKSADAGATWTIYDISQVNVTAGIGNTMNVIDANTIFVSYFDSLNNKIKFGSSTDAGATWSVVDVISNNVPWDKRLRMVSPDANTIYIPYHNMSPVQQFYMAKSTDGGTTWTTMGENSELEIEGVRFTHASIYASDANTLYMVGNNTKIFYFSTSTDGGINWSDPPVRIDGSNNRGTFNSIYAADKNNLFTSYYDAIDLNLRFGTSTDSGTTWTTSIVDATNDVGKYTSTDGDGQGTLFISYYDNTNKDLRFAKSTNNGITWTLSTIDSGGNVGDWTSLDAVNSNTIFISYHDSTNGNLKFAKSTDGGATWNISTIDNAATDVGVSSSLRAVNTNTIFIAYIDSTQSTLKLAKSTDGGATWNITSQIDVAVNLFCADNAALSLYAVDAQTIFISYYDVFATNLKFAKSTDGGATWTTSTVDSTNDTGANPSISATDANHIYIAYYYITSARLKHAESFDGGISWTITTPLDANSLSVGGWSLSLTTANDNGTIYEFAVAYSFGERAMKFSRIQKIGTNVGVGVTSPLSLLHVGSGGYLRFDKTSTGTPPSSDCDTSVEQGRIVLDTLYNRLYFCNTSMNSIGLRRWYYIPLTD